MCDPFTLGWALEFRPPNGIFKGWDNCVFMQSTGLKDKNGSEIFEGDIIKRHNKIQTVEWIGGDEKDYQGYDIDQVFGKWEVIGNIHENPELMSDNTPIRT